MTTHAMAGQSAVVGDIRHHTGSLVDRIAIAVTKLENWWIWHRCYRQTLRELGKLNARDLDDIGIAPGEIRNVAFEAANGALR